MFLQNHLLELKLASIVSLQYKDFWRMFGDGRHPNFRTLLHDTISPHLSPYAFQYWVQNADRFSHKFYKTGYSGLALGLFEWWARANGIMEDVKKMCSTKSMEEQKEIWNTRIRPVLFSPFIRRVMDNPMFMWNALGGKNMLGANRRGHDDSLLVLYSSHEPDEHVFARMHDPRIYREHP